MEKILTTLFGSGDDLDTLQMGDRAVVVFFVALALIRFSGRRSFGLRTPFDNIISILLGAILSRVVVGASPILPTIITCIIVTALHRILGWLGVRSIGIRRFVEGRKIILFKNDHLVTKNLSKALVCHEDVMQGLREGIHAEDFSDVKEIFMERNGEISIVKKKT